MKYSCFASLQSSFPGLCSKLLVNGILGSIFAVKFLVLYNIEDMEKWMMDPPPKTIRVVDGNCRLRQSSLTSFGSTVPQEIQVS